MSIARPIRFTSIAPRVYRKHIVKLSNQFSSGFPGFKNTSMRILLNRLRDPDASVQAQPFPEHFITMAQLYSRYRVNGVRVYVAYHGLTNSENDKFWSCCYSTSSDDGAADPYPPIAVGTHDRRDAFLQTQGVRKKMIAGTGTQQHRKDTLHHMGYWSVARVEEKRRTDMDDADYSGAVTPTGGAVADPIRQPNIWISVVSPNYTGFPDNETSDLAITLVYDVEWFDRRETLEVVQGETDP